MKRYNIMVSLALLALITFGIFILFNTGSDLAITFILLFIPATIGASFLARYLVTVRRKNIREKVMERDIMGIADRYTELIRILYDFEDKYGISAKEFRVELRKVKGGLFELGCKVNGKIRMDRAKMRKVVFADVEWMNKAFEGIRSRHEVVLYSRVMDKCKDYLEGVKELENAGYENIRDQMSRMKSKIEEGEGIDVDSFELSTFMNEVVSILDETLRICLRDANSLEGEGREIANADTSRIRTDIKIAEHSIEHGNYENALKVLNSAVERLADVIEDEFDRYKEGMLALTSVVVEISAAEEDKKEIEEIRKNIVECVSPSQIRKMKGYGDALMRKSISSLETVYSRIFEIEGKIAKENPTTAVYPVEPWAKDKMGEIGELKSMSASDIEGFIHKYRLLASGAHSRLMYDSDRLKYIKTK